MNDLDKLIAKFCAPNEESDRPVHYAVVKESPKQNRSERMIQVVLAAIAAAKEKAMTSGEKLPSKTQILAECGLSSNTIHRYIELLAAYEAARDACDKALMPKAAIKPKPSTDSVKTEYRREMERQILEAIAKAEETAIANGEPMPNKSLLMRSIGKISNNIYYYPDAVKAYEEAVERVGSRLGRASSLTNLVKQEIIKARDIALQNGWEMPSRAKIGQRAGAVGNNYISQIPSCKALYLEAQKACLEAIESRHQPALPPIQVEAPSPALQVASQPAPPATDKSTIAITVEVSEAVYDGLQRYLERNTDWDSDRVAEAALALFLLQNRAEQGENRELSRIYLDSVFRSSAA